MDIGLTQSTYEPYATTNYKTTQTTTSTTYQNVDLGNFQTSQTVDYGNALTTTADYPATNYGKALAPAITTTDFTTTNYETTPNNSHNYHRFHHNKLRNDSNNYYQ